ncbi:hypothetical protein KQX54_009593 [Cotesia glomerata]|uniref:Ankyrin repeat domain-containing protein n=1 Tax=Cotesia glomerata TaxID=32391 RepID=A0AAV7IIZ2_COTGL|nr:hypothetical protein KQX54_009593 [Cotesia glomerata]
MKQIINNYGLSYCSAWDDGYQLLREACVKNHSHLVEYLLSKNANINCDDNLVSPLQTAVMKNNKKSVKLLLENGAKAYTNKNKAPLQIAIERKNFEIAKLLFEHNAVNKSIHEISDILEQKGFRNRHPETNYSRSDAHYGPGANPPIMSPEVYQARFGAHEQKLMALQADRVNIERRTVGQSRSVDNLSKPCSLAPTMRVRKILEKNNKDTNKNDKTTDKNNKDKPSEKIQQKIIDIIPNPDQNESILGQGELNAIYEAEIDSDGDENQNLLKDFNF